MYNIHKARERLRESLHDDKKDVRWADILYSVASERRGVYQRAALDFVLAGI